MRVKAAPPAVAARGLRDVITGSAAMVNLAAPEVTPFSTTATDAVPGAAIRVGATIAVNCVALRKVVVSVDPFHCTTAPETNPVPFIVRVNAAPPAAVLFGLSDATAGGEAIVKAALLDVTPFCVTVTVAKPTVATRVAATGAVNCVLLRNVVVSVAPFHCTVAPDTKFWPFTVSVKPAWVAIAKLGLSELITGPGAMVKVEPLEVRPISVTVTVAEPALRTRLAATVAVSCEALTNAVVSVVEFHCTTAPETKPVPLTVSVKPA